MQTTINELAEIIQQEVKQQLPLPEPQKQNIPNTLPGKNDLSFIRTYADVWENIAEMLFDFRKNSGNVAKSLFEQFKQLLAELKPHIKYMQEKYPQLLQFDFLKAPILELGILDKTLEELTHKTALLKKVIRNFKEFDRLHEDVDPKLISLQKILQKLEDLRGVVKLTPQMMKKQPKEQPTKQPKEQLKKQSAEGLYRDLHYYISELYKSIYNVPGTDLRNRRIKLLAKEIFELADKFENFENKEQFETYLASLFNNIQEETNKTLSTISGEFKKFENASRQLMEATKNLRSPKISPFSKTVQSPTVYDPSVDFGKTKPSLGPAPERDKKDIRDNVATIYRVSELLRHNLFDSQVNYDTQDVLSWFYKLGSHVINDPNASASVKEPILNIYKLLYQLRGATKKVDSFLEKISSWAGDQERKTLEEGENNIKERFVKFLDTLVKESDPQKFVDLVKDFYDINGDKFLFSDNPDLSSRLSAVFNVAFTPTGTPGIEELKKAAMISQLAARENERAN